MVYNKALGIWIIGMLLFGNIVYAFSFKINVLGYEIEYKNPEELQYIDNVKTIEKTNKDIPVTQKGTYEVINAKTIEPQQLHKFDKDIALLNDIPEVTKALGDLGYSRIGFTDTDTNDRYIFMVSNGEIMSVYKDKAMYAEVETKGSLQKIKDYAYRKDFERLKLAVEIPFMVKLKLLLTQWF